MEFLISGTLAAFRLGILKSISLCPFATNVAELTFISNKVKNTGSIFLSKTFYTIGRMLDYLFVAFLVIPAFLLYRR